ncbi:unnamed protein product [Ixodes hexagonus]
MSTFDLTRPADSSESEDDDDYVPSAEESEGDLSDAGNDDADSDVEDGTAKKTKKGGKTRGSVSKKRRGGMKFDQQETDREASPQPSAKATEEPTELSCEEKQKADLLWADFLKDVGPLPKKGSPQAQTPAATSSPTPTPKPEPATATPSVEKKVKITKVMNFAGETVLVDKEVDADSKEAQCHAKDSASPSSGSATALLPGTKRPAGAKSVLNQLLNKKQKLSVLEKSRLDWERHKREKGIEEEIQTHNRGKDGYLEKQAFLQRADLRQFEIEKDLRAKARVTRLV